MTNLNWHGKPYYSLDAYCKNAYGHKCYKIALDAGFTCPNRDGTLGTSGCIFCSAGGSGDFAAKGVSITDQIQQGKALWGDKKVGEHFIAYFQAYTNTYGPLSYLESIYTAALDQPEIVGISIATRPDCLGEEVLSLLDKLQKQYPHKFIWIELGLQTIHEQTAKYIRRGYELPCFEEAVAGLNCHNIPWIVHIILGLPGETKEAVYETITYINHFQPFGIKLQLLHVLEGTDLATDYKQGKFTTLTKEEYLEMLIHSLELLSPDIVIHRLTGDGPKDLLLAPMWSRNKKDVLNTLHREMSLRDTYQGRLFHATGSIDTL